MSTTADFEISTILKGSPQYAIDQNGMMTITTTWIVMPTSTSLLLCSSGWLAFENTVEKWAGKVGDAYKRPSIQSDSKEANSYIPDETFVVSDIAYYCVEGRTHYEVTFTNIQNLSVMKVIGNVSVDINENNEITKTINYQIDAASDSYSYVDSLFADKLSGTLVDWAGASYLISSSSYNAVSPTRYEISITAQDMSIMMIGNPQKNVDAFGLQTMTVTWRYSVSAYESADIPLAGEDASAFLGLQEGSGYVVSDVSIQPVGVLGYNVTINAKYIAKQLIRVSKQETRKSSGRGYYTNHDIQYQSDQTHLQEFENLVGTQASDLVEDAVGTVSSISIEENGRNDYNIQISTTNEPAARAEKEEDLEDQVEVSMSQSEFVLDARQAGWFQGLSGEYYRINKPPTTRYTYLLSDTSLHDMANTSMGINLSLSDILAYVRGTAASSAIGYDRVVGVQGYVNSKLKWLSHTERAALTDLSTVQNIKMEGYVYAQPTMNQSGHVLRNLLFEEWSVSSDCPIRLGSNARIDALPKLFLTYKIKTMDISVSMYYKGKAAKALKKDFSYYYRKAINYVNSSAFTSYKGNGVSFSEVSDSDGDLFTQVTCNISALLKGNAYGLRWNSAYDGSFVQN